MSLGRPNHTATFVMNLSPSVVKNPELSSEKQIDDLADADLSAILERLPPYDRLIASEVCCRWLGLSRKAWVDVTELDLSPIPGKHIGAVVRQCPNLKSVFALKKSFSLNELAVLTKSNSLSTVKLHDCNFVVKSDPDPSFGNDAFAKIFSENLQHVSLSELIWHYAYLRDYFVGDYGRWAVPGSLLADSLTHLQLSGLGMTSGACPGVNLCLNLNGLRRLQNLECLILHHTPDFHVVTGFSELCALQSLKELFLGSVFPASERDLARLISMLPKLEGLFINGIDGDDTELALNELLTKNSVLRILVLSGTVFRELFSPPPLNLPIRKRFPHGFGSDPLPLLHVFVGKQASEHFHFATSSSDAAVIHPIDMPTPQFLEREDIAPIFEGVWVADKIKDVAKNGGELLSYDG